VLLLVVVLLVLLLVLLLVVVVVMLLVMLLVMLPVTIGSYNHVQRGSYSFAHGLNVSSAGSCTLRHSCGWEGGRLGSPKSWQTHSSTGAPSACC
jgi:hypothetical protein